MKVFFAIPLRSKQTSTDWDIVCERLKFTIDSIKSNLTPPGYSIIIIICGHEIPSFLSGNKYKDINFIRSDKEIPACPDEFMLDKGQKKKTIIRSIDTFLKKEEQALFMFFDADDILHKYAIVNIIRDLETSKSDDVVFKRGYFFDLTDNRFGFFNGEDKLFYRVCGSSFISKIKGGEAFDYLNKLNNHTKFPSISEGQGRKVKYSDFPAVAYIVNHGANDVSQRGGNTPIDNLFKRYGIDPEVHKTFIEDFGIDMTEPKKSQYDIFKLLPFNKKK